MFSLINNMVGCKALTSINSFSNTNTPGVFSLLQLLKETLPPNTSFSLSFVCWYNNLHKLSSYLSHYTVLKIWATHSCSHLQAGERTHLHKPSLKNPHRDACTRKPEADSHFIMGQKCSFINYTTHIYASLVHSRVSSPSLFFASLFLFIPLSSPLEVKLLSSQQRGQSVWPPLFVFSSSTICVCVLCVWIYKSETERERKGECDLQQHM